MIYEGVQPRPGDFVYKDVNKDGIIDRRDEVPIGYGQVPRINYSAMFSVSYKGFDFSCMFQGVAQTNGVYQDWGYMKIKRDLVSISLYIKMLGLKNATKRMKQYLIRH